MVLDGSIRERHIESPGLSIGKSHRSRNPSYLSIILSQFYVKSILENIFEV